MTLNTFPALRQECDLQDVSHIGKLFALFACPLGLFPGAPLTGAAQVHETKNVEVPPAKENAPPPWSPDCKTKNHT